MNKFSFLIFICISISSFAQVEFAKEGYKLVWSDEFNHNGRPDTTKWKHENGFIRNQELQWYQPDNAWCENGMLVIEARKVQKPNPRYKEGSNNWAAKRKKIEYTSASINTAGKHTWKYGRFVMRAKINVSGGMWPAWWTLGVGGEWPANGEIDIMEYYRDMLLANIAVGTDQRYKAHWYSKTKDIKALGGKKWADNFHIWRMDWDENSIALYVDDMLLNKVDMDSLHNRDKTGLNPFEQPHYMLVNLAIGGMNGGDVGDTVFPNRFEVDYVRVYQKDDQIKWNK